MDYYYNNQLDDKEIYDSEDYDYDSIISPDESLWDVYQGCVKSSTKQVQQYVVVLLGCVFLQHISWNVVNRVVENRHQYIYHLISIVCGLMNLWFYVGMSSLSVLLHIMNICLFLKLAVTIKVKYMGTLLCIYTLTCQLILEYLLKTEYESIRAPQMVVGMKLISVAFEIQDENEKYESVTYMGYVLSPSSLILGPWISLKEYKPNFNTRFYKLHNILSIFLNVFLAVLFLNLSNCIIPWLKQFLNIGIWLDIYLTAFSVRCSHYFVCYLSQAALVSTTSNTSGFYSFSFPLFNYQATVNPISIEFPRSLSDVIRNWNIPMHLWLKRYIFTRLCATKCPYPLAIFLTYLVSCLVHGFNSKVHLVLISLAFFSYSENLLRSCLAQVFDACIESTSCKNNCVYSNCPRRPKRTFTSAILLVRFVNFTFSVLVIMQLAYLGIVLDASPSPNLSSESKIIGTTIKAWSTMNFMGHVLAIIMFIFYKCV